MPELNVKTKGSRSVWKSPDGQREIFELVLDYNGSDVKAKTYSKDISVVGWSGTVESYEKEGRNGSETFVKQPAKEGGSYGGGHSSPNAKPQGDNFTMYLSYAKDIAVALLGTKEGYDQGKYASLLADVATGGETLYEAHMGATPAKVEKEDEVIDSIAGEDLLKNIDEVFGITGAEDESPWKP